MTRPLGVVGAGAWGTALAQAMASDGTPVRLWAREPEVIEAINTRCENSSFLPGVPLSPLIEATGDLTWVGECKAVFVVTPAQHMRAVLAELPSHAEPLILCSKGIELSLIHI